MSEDLWGTGEEEVEEEVTGALSTQSGDPPPAGRDPAWQIVGAGKSRSATAGEGGKEGTPSPPSCQEPALLQWAASRPWSFAGFRLSKWAGGGRGGSKEPGCRTLCHPSFQRFYSATLGCSRCSRHPPPGGPAWEAGPPPFLDCSSFFYMDPTQPPGSRIYNWLSCCSLEVLHRLPLDTPTPIMAPQETPPAPGLCTRRRWLSCEELQAVSALLELPAAAQAAPQADSGAQQGGP